LVLLHRDFCKCEESLEEKGSVEICVSKRCGGLFGEIHDPEGGVGSWVNFEEAQRKVLSFLSWKTKKTSKPFMLRVNI
jgi:hypothetical protein